MATYQGGQGGQQKPPQGQEKNVKGQESMRQGKFYGKGDRVTSDCRSVPGSNCSLSISGTEQEVLDVAVQHAVKKHGLQDNQETRNKIQQSFKKGGESLQGENWTAKGSEKGVLEGKPNIEEGQGTERSKPH